MPRSWTKKQRLERSGSGNPKWHGGKQKTSDGYVNILVAPKKRVLEHRLKMQNKIGRKIRKDEVVHHRNGIKTDNRIMNLELLKKKDHDSHHGKLRIPYKRTKEMNLKVSRKMIGNKNALKNKNK